MKEKLKECLSIHKEAIWIKTGQEKETIPAIINTLLDEEDITCCHYGNVDSCILCTQTCLERRSGF